MAILPEGMKIELAFNDRTKRWYWHVSCSEEYIKRSMLKIIDERIKRAEIALPLCKHTKRKHHLSKLLKAMREVRERYIGEFNNIDKDL
ncbi:hypothetical protein U1P98_18595 [Lysinibacillus irui]|uniref:Uncharacterized protein n=1 Tax=Lysinibacillus irui TaxID=2998077 RepID=A0ABU5NQP0_9BACI|nr:hypothetical protein [Lysinibacillus irui]MEA0556065.1 hypothetical protein [Lysinibacillus irui]MEA0978319.1 hypothetical protein [Lysinibacillus irui]MEA1044473.1 hypothetical protein [Lysinibacillus irui]